MEGKANVPPAPDPSLVGFEDLSLVDAKEEPHASLLLAELWKDLTEGDAEAAVTAVRAFLQHGGDVNYADDNTGITPVFVAAERGHTQALRVLLESGDAT